MPGEVGEALAELHATVLAGDGWRWRRR